MKFINDILDSMEARRRREERAAMLLFGGGCLAFIVLGVVMGIVITVMNAIETANVQSTYGDTYASACQMIPAGAESIDNLTDAATPRQILLLIGGTQRRHGWHSDLPEQWRADNEDEVALIGCVQEEETVIETCDYLQDSRSGDTFTVTITREQTETTVTLLNPRTARRIDSMSVKGSEPEACPADDGSVTTTNTLYGDSVPWSAFATWIESYIFDN